MTVTFDNGAVKDGPNPNDPGSSSAAFDVGIFGDDDSPINPITKPASWVNKSNQYTLGDGGNAVLLGGQSLGTGAAISFQASAAACMVLGSWLGVDSTTPFDVPPTVTLAAAGAGVGSAWAPTSPAITTLTDGCAIGVGIMFDADPPINVTGMSDAGLNWTLVGLINSTSFGGGFANCAMMRLNTNQVTHGTFAAQLFAVTLSSTNTGTWGIFTFALRPQAAAAPFVGRSRRPFDDVADDPRIRRAAFSFPPIQAARAVLVSPRRPVDVATDDDRVRRLARVAPSVTAWQALSAIRRATDTNTDTEDRARRQVAAPASPAQPVTVAKAPRFADDATDDRVRRLAMVPPNVAPWPALGAQRRTSDEQQSEGLTARKGLAAAQPVLPTLAAPRRGIDDANDDATRRPTFAQQAQPAQASAIAQQRKPIDDPADDARSTRPALAQVAPVAQASAIAQPRRGQDAADEDRSKRPAFAAPMVAPWPALAQPRHTTDEAGDDAAKRRAGKVATAPVAQSSQLAQPIRRADELPEDRAGRPAFVAAAPVTQGSALARLRRPDDQTPDDGAATRRGAALPPAQYAQLWQPRRALDDTADDQRAIRRPLISAQARAVLATPRHGSELEADDRAIRRAALVPYAVTPWRALAAPRRPVDHEPPEERRARSVALAMRAFGILVARFRASKPVTRADASKPVTHTDASKSVSRRKVSK